MIGSDLPVCVGDVLHLRCSFQEQRSKVPLSVRRVVHDCCDALELQCPWPNDLEHLDHVLFVLALHLEALAEFSKLCQGESGAGAEIPQHSGLLFKDVGALGSPSSLMIFRHSRCCFLVFWRCGVAPHSRW